MRERPHVLRDQDAGGGDAEVLVVGDSVVIAGGATRVRLHVHTNEPERLFEAAARFGEVAQTKVEDMRSQHETLFDRNRSERVGIVTDSTCDLPPAMFEELNISTVAVRVYFGSENYLDKVTITPAEFYGRFAVTDVAPKTSQPPAGDFRRQFEFLCVPGKLRSILTLRERVCAAVDQFFDSSQRELAAAA